MRNQDVINEADEVVAWWDGESHGTVHALRLALDAGKPVTVYGRDGEEIERGPWGKEP